MDKYAELYTLSQEALQLAEERFVALDAKASNYLSVLTLLLGAAGFFARWVADNFLPPKTLLHWSVAGVGLLTALALLVAWLHVFRVLKVHKTKILPFTDDTIRFFDENRLIDILYALARGNEGAWQENNAVNELKARGLSDGYRWMMISIGLLVAFSLLYGLNRWL